MNNNSSSQASGGLGFTGALTILFIALKLTHVITWSWWWVLSPIWISAAAVLVIVGLVVLGVFVAESVKQRRGGTKPYRGSR